MKKLLLAVIFVASMQQVMAQAARKVLVEAFTGTWCGNCPENLSYIDQALDTYPTSMIAVANHGPSPYYYYGDTMYNTYTGNLAYYYYLPDSPNVSFPGIMVDRADWSALYPTNTTPQVIKGTEVDRNFITPLVQTRLNVSSPVNIEIATTYDSTTRAVHATVTANFVDTVSGNLRITCVLVEDKVVGDSYYSQENYFGDGCGANDPTCEFYHYSCVMPTTLTGAKPFYHKNVVRDNLSPIWGNTGIPSTVSSGASYTKIYNSTLPAAWNAANMKVLAFVGYYNPSTATGGEILNAEIVDLGQIINAVPENPSAIENVSLDAAYPNPFSQMTTINVNVPATQHVSVKIYDILGHEVATLTDENLSPGVHTLYWNGNGRDGGSLSNGLYLVTLKTEKLSLSRSIVLSRN